MLGCYFFWRLDAVDTLGLEHKEVDFLGDYLEQVVGLGLLVVEVDGRLFEAGEVSGLCRLIGRYRVESWVFETILANCPLIR